MLNTVILILMLLLLVVAWFMLPRFLVLRAVPRVILTFRRRNAVGAENAMTITELGLAPKSFMASMMQFRDYKPMALRLLLQAEIIQATGEGKLYLSEEKLAMTRWKGLK